MAPLPATIAILSPLIIAVFSIASTVSFAEVINGDGAISSHQRKFDYFILALQWPGTYCRRSQKCCSKNGCCRGENAPTRFTIHGLWPQYNNGGWPSCCTKSHFDMDKISTLRDDLDKYWPSLSCGSPSACNGRKGSFWGHEWEKHGTCALSVIPDEYEFFRTSLIIYFKYNVSEVLSEAGYVPSNSEKYPIGGIISAIQNAFHTTPEIACSNGAVVELRLCFYKDFKPRDCVKTSAVNDEVYASKSSCPKYVSLPIYSSLGLKNGGKLQPEIDVL